MTVVSSERRPKGRRAYAPKVEVLEALRLLSGSTASTLPQLVAEHGPLDGPPAAPPSAPEAPAHAGVAWDEALAQTRLSELLNTAPATIPAITAPLTASPATAPASSDVTAGLSQLDRYLNRTWYRAGIPAQQHDDCTQAVYAQLLQVLGRDTFDGLAADVGQHGIRDVLSRETAEGPDFFRAIDTVKKRAQREKTFQTLDGQTDSVAASSLSHTSTASSGDLHDAIARRLSPREAALVYETLKGSTPAEIAHQWGVAPKTVSNEKTRAFQKLREALVSDWTD
jgi:DNA-binding NarL/FixJ family response regulator